PFCRYRRRDQRPHTIGRREIRNPRLQFRHESVASVKMRRGLERMDDANLTLSARRRHGVRRLRRVVPQRDREPSAEIVRRRERVTDEALSQPCLEICERFHAVHDFRDARWIGPRCLADARLKPRAPCCLADARLKPRAPCCLADARLKPRAPCCLADARLKPRAPCCLADARLKPRAPFTMARIIISTGEL